MNLSEVGDLAQTIGIVASLGIFSAQQSHARREQRKQAYLDVELASVTLFQFEADHARELLAYKGPRQVDKVDEIAESIATSFYFQTLNLFEIAARLRRQNIIEPEVFGSWVIWFDDVCSSWFFREKWPEFRLNYTHELRNIFDEPVENFRVDEAESDRRKRFFDHVSRQIGCPIIRKWLAE